MTVGAVVEGMVVEGVEDGRQPGWWWADNVALDHVRTVGPTAWAVYCALARYAGARRSAWPAVGTIGEILRLSPRTVRRALQALRAARLIAIEPRRDASGRQTSNRFVLLPLAGEGAPNDRGEGDTGGRGRVAPVTAPEEEQKKKTPLLKKRSAPALPPGYRDACPAAVATWATNTLGWTEAQIAWWHAEFCDAVEAGKFRRPLANLEAAERNSFRRQVGRPVGAPGAVVTAAYDQGLIR